ncbi:MAG: hypothetical protein WC809_03115 [Sinimarinibacterium sp.]|jgi:hypothetical protein
MITRRRIFWLVPALIGLAALAYGLSRMGASTVSSAPSIAGRTQLAPADPDRLSARLIPNTDLPPEGTRSLFDHLVAQNDGLPYPFEALVEMIQKRAPSGSAPVALAIPFGRSLLKAQADFAHPRVLFAADFQAPNTPAALGVAPRGQLFLGFVENAREIEVISYNEAAGRYEYQLVQDYAADGARRIVYARRAVCTTCHQGGTPIFPQRPWNETNALPEIAAQIGATRGAEPYLGVPNQVALGVPERFDELTDIGAFTVAMQQVWIDACGPDAACRRLMLKLGLRYADDPGAFDAHAPEVAALRERQQTHWPQAGIKVPESDIRNRDPLAETRGWRGAWRSLFAPKTEPGAGARTNEDLEAFDRLPKLPAELDPLARRAPKRVLRAPNLDGVFGIAAQFTAEDLRQLEAQDGFVWSRVEARIERLPDSLFAPAPFSRVRALQALLAPSPAYCCLDVAEMSAPVAVTVPPLSLSPDSPLQPFQRYCFGCHRGNPSARLNFMAGADAAEVTENIRGKVEIRDALDWARYRDTDKASKLMPPADSAERARLEAQLAQTPQLLEQMREQVPGLFDF